jgi:hypothetical protein
MTAVASRWVGRLAVALVSDDESGLWELLEPLGFVSAVAGRTVMAPIGHTTDFCSVPRVPLVYEMLGNRARRAGTIHDRLYVTHELTREMADNVLYEMLVNDGVDACEAEHFRLAVRMFGGSHWGPDPAPVTLTV